MRISTRLSITVLSAAVAAVCGTATATEPCDDFGECKVLVEINSTDGDIGFHFLGDADDLRSMRLDDPNGAKIFEYGVSSAGRDQLWTESFGESAEPLCWPNPDEDPEDWEDIVTLREFYERWEAGTYVFTGKGEGGEMLYGETELSFNLPAAPQNVNFNGASITWTDGDDLGNCAPMSDPAEGVETIYDLDDIVDVVDADVFEIVMEPDVEDGDATGALVYSIRVPAGTYAVEVPALYLAALPENTPVKIEVGAISADDNATFTEVDGFCVNPYVVLGEDEECGEED